MAPMLPDEYILEEIYGRPENEVEKSKDSEEDKD